MDREDFDQWDADRKRRRAERQARRAEQRDEREDRKDRVLHTRISESLDETLRSAANELRVPVSNLVRNVLEDVFDVVETVTHNVEDLVGDIREEAIGVRDRFRRQQRRSSRTEWRSERESSREQSFREESAPPPPEPEAPVEERAPFPEVVGWQPLVLNREQRCADCGRDLIAGDQAYLGIGPPPQGAPYLCTECLRARS